MYISMNLVCWHNNLQTRFIPTIDVTLSTINLNQNVFLIKGHDFRAQTTPLLKCSYIQKKNPHQ